MTRNSCCAAETQDLGIRDLPDAHIQLIETQLVLEEVSSNVDIQREKVTSTDSHAC